MEHLYLVIRELLEKDLKLKPQKYAFIVNRSGI